MRIYYENEYNSQTFIVLVGSMELGHMRDKGGGRQEAKAEKQGSIGAEGTVTRVGRRY